MFENKAYYDLVRETMKKVEITEISPEDWKQFRQIRKEALKNEPHALSPLRKGDVPESEWDENDWREMTDFLNGEHWGCLVAKDRGQMIGTLGYSKTPNKTAILWGMYVDRNYRNKDIGKSLLDEALDILKRKAQCEKIELAVTGNNADVMDFYERFGFQMTEAIDETDEKTGEKYEKYVMTLNLKDNA